MSYQSSNLGRWLDKVLEIIFFQPNDELSNGAIRDHLSPDLQVKVNGRQYTYAEYKEAIIKARAKYHLTMEENRELLDVQINGDGIGHVAHMSSFTLSDKETGTKKQDSNVTLATIAEKEGKKILIELTEISTETR